MQEFRVTVLKVDRRTRTGLLKVAEYIRSGESAEAVEQQCRKVAEIVNPGVMFAYVVRPVQIVAAGSNPEFTASVRVAYPVAGLTEVSTPDNRELS